MDTVVQKIVSNVKILVSDSGAWVSIILDSAFFGDEAYIGGLKVHKSNLAMRFVISKIAVILHVL